MRRLSSWPLCLNISRGFGPVRAAHLAEANKQYAAAQEAFDKALSAHRDTA